MRIILALLVIAFPSLAIAGDRALILSDSDQQALIAVLDAAVKQGGINAVPQVALLLDKLQKAPVVQQQQTDSKPSEDKP